MKAGSQTALGSLGDRFSSFIYKMCIPPFSPYKNTKAAKKLKIHSKIIKIIPLSTPIITAILKRKLKYMQNIKTLVGKGISLKECQMKQDSSPAGGRKQQKRTDGSLWGVSSRVLMPWLRRPSPRLPPASSQKERAP